MRLRRPFAVAFATPALLAAMTAAAVAKPAFDVRAASLLFFSDVLAIVARTDATITTRDGMVLTGNAAYVDLVHDRILVDGAATARTAARSVHGDAIAYDVDAGTVDVLDATSGARRGPPALTQFAQTPIESDRFAFPDIEDRRTYIRSRHAAVTPHANARFAPAVFPTSPGALPVPSYLYTFAANAGFGANALGGATFDQPYGIAGGSTSLLAAHFRYEDGVGATFALDDHHVYGDNAYVVTSVDSPLRTDRVAQLTAYQRMGPRFSHSFTAVANRQAGSGAYSLTGAFGRASAEFDLSRFGPVTSLDLSARTPDIPLLGGAHARLRADAGFDAAPGGILSVLPDRANYATVWRHGVDIFAATPVVRAPFRTDFAVTVDVARTWFAFPHHHDTLSGSATLSKRFSPSFTLIGAYTAAFSYDIFPNAQALFFPTPRTPLVAPDGTPWPGFAAFTGASMTRGYTLDAFLTPAPNTSVRVTAAYATDFPQFHGFGRPPLELRFDARFRPLPNVGIDVGRGYDFDWAGRRFTRWTFSVLP
ncbi:MAG: hypothetical protein ABR591_04475 [Candidatus Velthaea sp.]